MRRHVKRESEARNPKSETGSKSETDLGFETNPGSEIRRKTEETIKPEKRKEFEINPRSSNAQVGRF
jgi:hypothetical protein